MVKGATVRVARWWLPHRKAVASLPPASSYRHSPCSHPPRAPHQPHLRSAAGPLSPLVTLPLCYGSHPPSPLPPHTLPLPPRPLGSHQPLSLPTAGGLLHRPARSPPPVPCQNRPLACHHTNTPRPRPHPPASLRTADGPPHRPARRAVGRAPQRATQPSPPSPGRAAPGGWVGRQVINREWWRGRNVVRCVQPGAYALLWHRRHVVTGRKVARVRD